jgi:hypothetical protein
MRPVYLRTTNLDIALGSAPGAMLKRVEHGYLGFYSWPSFWTWFFRRVI